jgi:hypothetical protein
MVHTIGEKFNDASAPRLRMAGPLGVVHSFLRSRSNPMKVRSLVFAVGLLASSAASWATPSMANVPCTVHKGNELRCAKTLEPRPWAPYVVDVFMPNNDLMQWRRVIAPGETVGANTATATMYLSACGLNGRPDPDQKFSPSAVANGPDRRVRVSQWILGAIKIQACLEVFIHSCGPTGCENLANKLEVIVQ